MFLAAVALTGCRKENRLNVFNWSDYVAHDTVPNFEREAEVRVRYGVFESAEEMLARVQSGNSGWDVVFPSNAFVEPMRDLALLAPLDHSRLPNLRHLAPGFQSPSWDPELRFSVPYMWGSTGIAYRTTLDPPPKRWADLWTERLSGRLSMLDDPAELFAACLKMRGRSVNATDRKYLDEAKRDAISQKRLVRAYLNAEARDQLVAGDLLAAQAWRLTAQQAIDSTNGELAFVYPEEGYPLYADCAAILRESSRQDLAHRFLDYLLRPRVAASVAIAMKTATCNAGARALLPSEMQQSPTYYPPPEVLARGEWFQPLSAAAQRLRDRFWTEIKAS